MTVSLRRLSRQEADEAFSMVRQPAQDVVLALALTLVRKRNNLRTRSLVAHLHAWERTGEVERWTPDQVNEMAMTRALALLALESETHHSDSTVMQAAWTRRRLAELLAESAAATEEAKATLATRIREAQNAA